MTIAVGVSEILLWLALLGILTALVAILFLPQNGPMPVALDRGRILHFAEAVGFFFAIIYALTILRVLT